MNSKRIFIFMAFVLLSCTTLMAQDADSKYATEMLKPGTAAPEFTLDDPEGKSYSLSSFQGRYVLLDFWASWCPDCRKDIPEVKRLHDLYGEQVQFVSISFDRKREDWLKYIDTNQMNWLQLEALQKEINAEMYKRYSIGWIPALYLIDDKGNIVLSTVMIEKVAKMLEDLNLK